MFQNINENTIEVDSENTMDKDKKVNIFTNVLSKNNLILYIVSFMLSFIGLGGEFSIFSISMLGACFASSIPVLGIIAFSLLGNFIKFGVDRIIRIFYNGISLNS